MAKTTVDCYNFYKIYNLYHVKDTKTLNLFRVLTVRLLICQTIDMSDYRSDPYERGTICSFQWKAANTAGYNSPTSLN